MLEKHGKSDLAARSGFRGKLGPLGSGFAVKPGMLEKDGRLV